MRSYIPYIPRVHLFLLLYTTQRKEMERCLERCQGRSRFGEEDQDRAPRRRSAPEAECSRFPVSGDAVASASSSRPGGDDYRPSRNPLLVEMSGIPPHLKPWVVEAIRVLQARPLVFIRSPDFRPHAFPLQQVETSEAGRTPRSNAEPGQGAPSAGEAVEEGYFLAGWSERTSSRRTRTLLSMCIVQIGELLVQMMELICIVASRIALVESTSTCRYPCCCVQRKTERI